MRFTFLGLKAFIAIFILLSACRNTDTKSAKGEDNSLSPTDPIAELEKSVKAHPDSLLLFAKLSDLYEEKGELEKALAILEKGLAADSTASILHNRRASIMIAKGDTASAISGLLKSLSYAPEQPDIHVELGFLYAAQKKKNALVIADFLLTQSNQPQLQTKARYLKGIYYSNVGETQNALEQFNECILNDYTFIDAYMEKGILLYNDKKNSEALKVFEKVMTISNTHAEAYFWTGKCLEAMNKKEEALDYYKKSIGLDDKITEAAEAIERLSKK